MSYGVNAAQGLQPRRYLNGSPWNNATNTYNIATGYATSIFTGDPVDFDSGNTGNIIIAPLTTGTGAPVLGVFQGCKYFDTNANFIFSPYWPASTTILANTTVEAEIADDPNIIFDIQSNGVLGATPLVLGNVGYNAQWVVATGSVISGQSAYLLDAITNIPATTQAYQLKILRATPVPGNVFGISYANAEVIINNHRLKSVGTVGV